MSDNELFTESLKHLAAAAPEEAPRRIASNLETAFRIHHVRRRKMRAFRWMSVAAALLLCAVLWMRWRNLPGQDSAARPELTAETSPAPVNQPRLLPNTPPLHQGAVPAQQRPSAAGSRPSGSGKFIPIPGVDPQMTSGSLMVVRLELPASALGLLGLPVTGDNSQDRVLADILMDQDGTPYAMRIVNGAN